MKNYKFSEIKSFLESKSITIQNKISNNEVFSGLGSLNLCNENDLTFFHKEKYSSFVYATKARGCFIKKINSNLLPKSCIPIIVDDPYLAYAYVSNFFYHEEKSSGLIENFTNIHPETIFGKNVQIDSFVTIKKKSKIDNNCILSNNTIIGPNVELGLNTIIMPNSVISHAIIGNNCTIQSGAIIGGKGFGFTPKTKVEIKHIGNVVVGNFVDIGSNTTIDRATIDSTIIEDNVRIDNLVQIAHNVKIGKNSIIAAQTGIAGSTEIGKNCIMGGQVGIAGHLKIGNNVTIAAKSGVTKNIDNDAVVAGFPAIDIKTWKRNIINQYKNIK